MDDAFPPFTKTEATMANAVKQIEWKRVFEPELDAATAAQHVLLDFSAAPM